MKPTSLVLKRAKILFIHWSYVISFPTIEVAGKCNLFCRTQDMGLPNANKGKGHMSISLFKLIIDKLSREIPFINSVALYIWGEPIGE